MIKSKFTGWTLLSALIYGPLMFALLIVLHLQETGFSFMSHAMCNLAVGSSLNRTLFLITAWGMALLHLPFLLYWPTLSRSFGGNRSWRFPFHIAGLLFTAGFLLFPIFTLDAQNLSSYRVHQVLAALYFPACAVIALVPWCNLKTTGKVRALYKEASWLWMLSSLLYIVPFVVFAPSAPPYPGWVNLLNWVFLACYGLWALVYGLLLTGKIAPSQQ